MRVRKWGPCQESDAFCVLSALGLVLLSAAIVSVAVLPAVVGTGAIPQNAEALTSAERGVTSQVPTAFFAIQPNRSVVTLTGAIAASVILIVVWAQAIRLARRLKRLQRAASTDQLTGLANRSEIFAVLADASNAQNKSNWVMLIDLDGFKGINDSLGHDAGDQLLVGVARRIRNAVRDGDLVGRLGGDEFVVMLQDADRIEDPRQVADRIVLAVAAPFRLGARNVRATASIGMAEVGDDQTEHECPLGRADLALYKAKELGGSQVVTFEPGLNSRIEQRKSLDEQLRTASTIDQFSLFFQPECDLRTNEVVGAEALLRWDAPGQNIVEASEFIDGLDEAGLLIDLAPHIVEEAIRFGEAHPVGTNGFTLRVNMRADQLLAPNMVSVLTEAAGRCAPAQLCIELSTRCLSDPTTELVTQMRKIQRAGVEIAIDDFGIGNACLLLLSRVHVDELKIDRRLVEELAFCDPEASIAFAMIRLAQARGIRVSAQGIETREQLDALVDAGCERGQGYLFGPAVEPAEFRNGALTPGMFAHHD